MFLKPLPMNQHWTMFQRYIQLIVLRHCQKRWIDKQTVKGCRELLQIGGM
jgi:hypothetical protein